MDSFQCLGMKAKKGINLSLLLEYKLLNVQDSVSDSKHFYRPSLFLQRVRCHHTCSIRNTYTLHWEYDFRECGVQSVGVGFSLLTSSIMSGYFQRPQRHLRKIMSLGTVLKGRVQWPYSEMQCDEPCSSLLSSWLKINRLYIV